MEPDLELKNLYGYIGTQSYYNYLGVKLTDGIRYIMENGYSWFVTDTVALIVAHPRIRRYLARDSFLAIKLRLRGLGADLIVEDGNENQILKDHYEFTDAKRELTLFYDNGVLMLPSEY
jgi:hypothetical protein